MPLTAQPQSPSQNRAEDSKNVSLQHDTGHQFSHLPRVRDKHHPGSLSRSPKFPFLAAYPYGILPLGTKVCCNQAFMGVHGSLPHLPRSEPPNGPPLCWLLLPLDTPRPLGPSPGGGVAPGWKLGECVNLLLPSEGGFPRATPGKLTHGMEWRCTFQTHQQGRGWVTFNPHPLQGWPLWGGSVPGPHPSRGSCI